MWLPLCVLTSLSVLAAPGEVASSQPLLVTGRVTDANGSPTGDVSVSAVPEDDDPDLSGRTVGGKQPISVAKTGRDGRFVLHMKPGSGMLSLVISSPARPTLRVLGVVPSNPSVDALGLSFPESRIIEGRVVDGTGRGLSGVSVAASELPRPEGVDLVAFAEAKTDEEGRFRIANAPAGFGTLDVRGQGFIPVRRQYGTDEALQEVTLTPGETVRGSVVDRNGGPCPGAFVVADRVVSRTDPEGHFLLDGVEPGPQELIAFCGPAEAAAVKVVVKKGTGELVDLHLGPARRLAGRILSASGSPISGAIVAVSHSGFQWTGREILRRTRSDAQGRFSISGLLPRHQIVEAFKKGFVRASMPVELGGSRPGELPLVLWEASAVRGAVLDEAGVPVEGARVGVLGALDFRSAMRTLSERSLFQPITAATKADGTFELRELQAGQHVNLIAYKTGFVPAVAEALRLTRGQTIQGVRFTLRRGNEARGRVVDGKGNPVARAVLRLFPADNATATPSPPGAAPEAASDQGGEFLIRGFERGSYMLRCSAVGYAAKAILVQVETGTPNLWSIILRPPVTVWGTVRNSSGTAVSAARVSLAGDGDAPRRTFSDAEGHFVFKGVTPGTGLGVSVLADGYLPLQEILIAPVEGLALVVRRPARLRGRVEDERTRAPIPGFSVGRSNATAQGFTEGVPAGGFDRKELSSPDGLFEIPDFGPGSWTLHVSAPGYRPATVTGIDMNEGDTREDVVIALRRGSVLSGRLIDMHSGQGIGEAMVSWQSAGPGVPTGVAAIGIARLGNGENVATTDGTGEFRIDNLELGKVVVSAAHPEYSDVTETVDVTEAGARLELRVERAGSVTGTVVEGRSHRPGSGVAVLLESTGGSGVAAISARTSASGHFAFDGLQPGSYAIRAERSEARLPVSVSAGQAVENVVIEQPSDGATLRGRALGLAPQDLDDLQILGSGSDFAEVASPAPDGSFAFTNVPPGLVSVQARLAGPRPRTTSRQVAIEPGASEASVELTFGDGSRVTGQVSRFGQPLPNVVVQAVPQAGETAGNGSAAVTDREGHYDLEGLQDGQYLILASNGRSLHRIALAVAGDARLDIELPSTGLKGLITDAETGAPIPGMAIHVTGQDAESWRSTRTDSIGRYTLESLGAGDYLVSFDASDHRPESRSVTVGSEPLELNVALTPAHVER